MLDWLKNLTSDTSSTKQVKELDPLPQDPLLRKAKLIKRKSELTSVASRKRAEKGTVSRVVEEGLDEVAEAARFTNRFYQSVRALWSAYLSPLLGWLAVPCGGLKRLYVRLYNRFAFIEDADGERSVFSPKRSAVTVLSLLVGTLLFLYSFVFHVVPGVVLFGYDAVAINLFSYEDSLVFSKPDWVVGEPGVLSVFACKKYPCVAQDDSVEYRIRDSVYLDVVRTFTRFEPHDPGELAGAFLSEENACTFKAYGIRVKYFHLYPYIFEATCTPIDGSVREGALATQ